MWAWRLFLNQSLDVSTQVLVRITSHCAVSEVRVLQWEALNWGSVLTDSLCGSLVSVTMVLVLHLMGYSEPLEETVLQHPSGEHSPACCAVNDSNTTPVV